MQGIKDQKSSATAVTVVDVKDQKATVTADIKFDPQYDKTLERHSDCKPLFTLGDVCEFEDVSIYI